MNSSDKTDAASVTGAVGSVGPAGTPTGNGSRCRADGRRSPGLHRDGKQLLTLTLGQASPDAIWLMDFQRMSAAGEHRRAVVADRFGARLAPGAGWPPLAFRMEEIGTRHAAAGRMQLPVPHVGIRPGKTPGIGHGDAHLRHSPPSTRAHEASIGACYWPDSGRICIDIDAAVIMTLGPFGERIKSGLVIFGDQCRVPRARQTPPTQTLIQGARRGHPTADRSTVPMNGWRTARCEKNRARSVVTIPHQTSDPSYVEQQLNYTPSKVAELIAILMLIRPVVDASSPNGCHQMVSVCKAASRSTPSARWFRVGGADAHRPRR